MKKTKLCKKVREATCTNKLLGVKTDIILRLSSDQSVLLGSAEKPQPVIQYFMESQNHRLVGVGRTLNTIQCQSPVVDRDTFH